MSESKQEGAAVVALKKLIEEYLPEDVREVAYYYMQRELVGELAHLAMQQSMTETPRLPPETVIDLLATDDTLAHSAFYLEHFAVLRTLAAMVQIRQQTRAYHLPLAMEQQNPDSKSVVDSLLVGFVDTLSAIVFMSQGPITAKEFDAKARFIMVGSKKKVSEILGG